MKVLLDCGVCRGAGIQASKPCWSCKGKGKVECELYPERPREKK